MPCATGPLASFYCTLEIELVFWVPNARLYGTGARSAQARKRPNHELDRLHLDSRAAYSGVWV